jgi:hypothetical protein
MQNGRRNSSECTSEGGSQPAQRIRGFVLKRMTRQPILEVGGSKGQFGLIRQTVEQTQGRELWMTRQALR